MATGAKQRPNILVTGTPGTGKTTLCRELAARLPGLRHFCVSELAKENGYLDGWDEETQCNFLDEDRLLDDLEDRLGEGGGCVVDYHSAELFPERWFKAIFVLRTDNSVLYQRLKARGYPEPKVQQNVQCEIFQVLLDEAREAYKPEIVHELRSDGPEDLEANLAALENWWSRNSV